MIMLTLPHIKLPIYKYKWEYWLVEAWYSCDIWCRWQDKNNIVTNKKNNMIWYTLRIKTKHLYHWN